MCGGGTADAGDWFVDRAWRAGNRPVCEFGELGREDEPAFERVNGGGGGGGNEDDAKLCVDVFRRGLGAGCLVAMSLEC